MEKFIKEIYDLRPWYHDFKFLGIKTNFPPKKKYYFFGPETRQIRKHVDQQKRKESAISPFIKKSLDYIPNKSNLSVLDLFCSDGYYGFLTQKFCPDARLVGIDSNKDDIDRCRKMANFINLGPTSFIEDDVYHYVENCDSFDLILCTGGLYHIPDPLRLLKGLRKITKQYLVIQSAITVEHDDPDYFETPNPWFKTWGSLFTNTRLFSWVKESGFNILENCVNRREEPNPRYIGASNFLLK